MAHVPHSALIIQERQTAEACFGENLDLIERVVASLCRRHGLQGDDADDFASWTRLKLVDNDYAVLRKFRGESSIGTYLTVVFAMLFREYRVQRWGRWRPSAEARRRGEVAVRLETLVHRDGFPLHQAAESLRSVGCTTLSDRDLAVLLAELPPRLPLRPRESGPELLLENPSPSSAEDRILAEEAERERRSVNEALSHALGTLPPEDRLIVRMRFMESMSVANIARGLALPQKPLYRRIERALSELRSSLQAAGVSREHIQTLLDHSAS